MHCYLIALEFFDLYMLALDMLVLYSELFDLDLNNLYHYMIDNFVEKTEPSLGKMDLIRLSPYLGSQLKDILPNPLQELTGDDTKNEESEMQ